MSDAKKRALERGQTEMQRIRGLPDMEFQEYLAEELYLYAMDHSMGRFEWDELPDVGTRPGDPLEKAKYRAMAKWAMQLCGRRRAIDSGYR